MKNEREEEQFSALKNVYCYLLIVVENFVILVQMIPATRKRLIIALCVFGVVCLVIRHLFNNGPSVLVPQQNLYRTPGAPVLVMVFYEALCSDSKYFITKQLLPSFRIGSALMDVQLIPYGKAKTISESDGYSFDCQHGAVECQANKYHSCAIEVIQDPLKRLEVVGCMIRDNRLPKDALHRCAKHHGVENVDLIQKCYDSSHGSELLKLNGDATNALRPSVSFIPTITLDGSQTRQAIILKDLLGEVCRIVGDTDRTEEICKHRTINE